MKMRIFPVVLAVASLSLFAGLSQGAIVAHYTFEEGSGTSVGDSSGNGYNGTLTGSGNEWVAGKVGTWALDLNNGASGEYVATSVLASTLGIGGNNAKTVTAWVQARTDGSNHFTSNGGVYQIGSTGSAGQMFSLRTLSGGDNYRAQFWSSPDFDFNGNVTKNQWAHTALVHDGTMGRAYFNGSLVALKGSTLNTNDGRALEIGRYSSGDYFNGMIDEVVVHNTARNSAQLAAEAGFVAQMVLDPTSGKYYAVGPNDIWEGARDYAATQTFLGQPGYLTTVNDKAESTFLGSIGGWIGYNDAATEGTFVWVNGETPGYTNWNGGEPNNAGNEDYAEVSSNSRWNDLGAANGRKALVEFDTGRIVPANILARNRAGGVETGSGAYSAINFNDPENRGTSLFVGDAPFPNDTSGDDNNFETDAIARVVIPAAGDYTFGVRHDDDVTLAFVGGAGGMVAPGTADKFVTLNLAAGTYSVRLRHREGGGGASVELAATAGAYTGWNDAGANFQLVGDTLNGGLAAAPVSGFPHDGTIWIDNAAYSVRQVFSTGGVGNLSQLDDLLDNGNPGILREATGRYWRVDLWDTGNTGHFGFNDAYPADSPSDDNNYGVEVTGKLVVTPADAGWYTFLVDSDDGFRLTIDGLDFELFGGQGGTALDNGSLIFPNGRGAGTGSFGSIFLPAGEWDVTLRHWEGGGGSSVELGYAPGIQGWFNDDFQLLTAVPEPATMGLMALAVAGLGGYWRKRRRA